MFMQASREALRVLSRNLGGGGELGLRAVLAAPGVGAETEPFLITNKLKI